MSGFPHQWYIAAGWTIDLFLGKETREHADVDIAIWRKDQLEVRKYLDGWQFEAVVPDQKSDQYHLEPMLDSDVVTLPIHELHAQNSNSATKDLEVLLLESDTENWIYRRDPQITLPLQMVGLKSDEGIPFLNPIIVLLFKAKKPRAKDGDDFRQELPHLDSFQKSWLKRAINMCHPDHEWLSQL
jgi:hypothetical protein